MVYTELGLKSHEAAPQTIIPPLHAKSRDLDRTITPSRGRPPRIRHPTCHHSTSIRHTLLKAIYSAHVTSSAQPQRWTLVRIRTTRSNRAKFSLLKSPWHHNLRDLKSSSSYRRNPSAWTKPRSASNSLERPSYKYSTCESCSFHHTITYINNISPSLQPE